MTTRSASPSVLGDVTVYVGPGKAAVSFGGSIPEVPAAVTMPAGWYADDMFVSKVDADPVYGMVLTDVGNVYADGCQWQTFDPPVGPTVDDLVAAYATLPGFGPPARDITVDGHPGKQIVLKVPSYNPDECIEGKFGILQLSGFVGGDAPNLWAQTPEQLNTMWILDVDGVRLQVLTGHPPDVSDQDRAELNAMVNSLEIG